MFELRLQHCGPLARSSLPEIYGLRKRNSISSSALFKFGACLHAPADCSGDPRREASRKQSDGEASPESRNMSLGRHRESTLARAVQQNVTGLSLECHWFVVREPCGWTRFELFSDFTIVMSRPLAKATKSLEFLLADIAPASRDTVPPVADG